MENRLCARGKIRENENKNIGRVQDSKAGMLTERLYMIGWIYK